MHIFFFSRTTGPISTKRCTKHPWVKWIQVCSNEGHRFFPSGDDSEIAEINWWNLELSFFSWTTGLISTKLGSNEGSLVLQRGDYNEIEQSHWNIFNITWAYFNQTCRDVSVCERHSSFYKKLYIQIWIGHNHLLFLNVSIIIALRKCVYWLDLLFRWAISPIGFLFLLSMIPSRIFNYV